MAKTKINPEVRFAGFIEDWETVEVSKLLEERDIQSPKSEEYPLMAFVAYKGVVPKGNRYNREFLVTDLDNKKYKKTENGDFIYSSNNLETGSIGLNKYGKASISPVYSIFKPTMNGNSDFIGSLLTKKDFINKMVRWRQGVVYGQWRIHEKDFLKIEVCIPKIEEQEKIGDLFKWLETQIDKNELKQEQILNIKNSMLDNLFAKQNINKPAIRVGGFHEQWHLKSISSVASINPKSELPEKFNYVDLESVVGTKLLGSKKYSKFKAPSRAQRLAKKGDLFYQMVRPYQKNNYLFESSAKDYVFSTGYAQIRPEIDGYFLLSMVQSNYFLEKVLTRCTGSSYPAISSSDLAQIEILIPVDPDEQILIGKFFKSLDNMINLHQVELQKLKELRKAFSSKMFI